MKLISFLLIIYLGASQVHSAPNDTDLLSVARQKLSDLQIVVTDLQASALDTLILKIDDIRNVEESVRLDSITAVDNQYQLLVEHIRGIVDCAESLGQDPRECIADRQVVLMNLPDKITALIDDCLRINLNEGIDIIEMSVAVIDTLHNTTSKLQGKIDECELLPFNDICLREVIMEISLMDSEIRTKVSETLDKAEDMIVVINNGMFGCSNLRVEMVSYHGNEIINEMLDCVNSGYNSTSPQPTTTPGATLSTWDTTTPFPTTSPPTTPQTTPPTTTPSPTTPPQTTPPPTTPPQTTRPPTTPQMPCVIYR